MTLSSYIGSWRWEFKIKDYKVKKNYYIYNWLSILCNIARSTIKYFICVWLPVTDYLYINKNVVLASIYTKKWVT